MLKVTNKKASIADAGTFLIFGFSTTPLQSVTFEEGLPIKAVLFGIKLGSKPSFQSLSQM